MKDQLLHLDAATRREFMLRTAKTALGVSLIPVGSSLRAATGGEGPGFGKAKAVIYLFMEGGMSHIDTFDPKTGSTKGAKDPIKTKADGIDFLGGYMTEMAKQADKFSLIRSMTSKTGVHEGGRYIMRTGYEPRGTIIHPSMGAWASHFLGRIKGVTLPDSVTIGSGQHPGAGFFPPALSPVPISSPESGLQNTRSGVGDAALQKRVALMNEFDAGFRNKFKNDDVKAYTEFYEETMKLLKSEDLKAFDISQEPAAIKEKYGRGFGQGCLLARRLVQHGVRFVEVQTGGWDMHNTIDQNMNTVGGGMDKAFAALLEDLKEQGMLESTLVVLGSEFGRTPDINENSGRDHYPLAFTAVMAGGGVKGGFTYGSTDKDGRRVADKQATPPDFLSTIGHAMGLPVDEVVMSPSNRPFTVGDKGSVITEMFA
ncbi:MAG: DUF1501 domain-containing protein [Verrucomicrobiaceae bacterium]|nr:DUF1501 domain-containing protein [Verrucomicrobiaceae bacterium]